MLKKNLLLAAGGVLLTALTVSCCVLYISMPKTAYVNIQQIYEEFALKKELDKKYSHVENARKLILDSLQQDLLSLSSQMNPGSPMIKTVSERFNNSKQNFLTVQARFEEDNMLLSRKYDEEIWNRINLYVREYGERNNYTYIYGANGEGNLMFASDSHDITDEVKDYINKRYQGDLK